MPPAHTSLYPQTSFFPTSIYPETSLVYTSISAPRIVIIDEARERRRKFGATFAAAMLALGTGLGVIATASLLAKLAIGAVGAGVVAMIWSSPSGRFDDKLR
mgnify:CR=1 FL=1